MTNQFHAISVLAVGKVSRGKGRNGVEIAEVLSAIVILVYGLRLVYPTPGSANLLAVDAHSAGFLAIGTGQLIGIAQHCFRLRRAMSLLALLYWGFTAFYLFEPAQLVFAAIAGWAFLQMNKTNQAHPPAAETVARPLREYALHDVYE